MNRSNGWQFTGHARSACYYFTKERSDRTLFVGAAGKNRGIATIMPPDAAAISSVYITDELKTRAPKPQNYLSEKLALQELATVMIDRPEAVLPRFVELAMDRLGGISAGLSLLEAAPAPGVFRWHHVHGVLARFDGATTPRNHSPCGVTLDARTPVLCSHPERAYDWVAQTNVVLPEVLLTPLFYGEEEPLGTIWIVADSEGYFDADHARILTDLAAFVSIALRMSRAENRLKTALDEQETLAQEMSHRVKNTFALMDGLIRLSSRAANSKEELASDLTGRLHALSAAHSLVRRGHGSHEIDLGTANLCDLLRLIIKPHEATALGGKPRFSMSGPPVLCSDHATNGMALVMHELATNAAKYGSLAADGGGVDLRWDIESSNLSLIWREYGGPDIAGVPAKKGFGSKMTNLVIEGQFGGTLRHDWQRSGLEVTITMPLKNLTR